MKKLIVLFALCTIAFLYSSILFSKDETQKTHINILTWWEYLDQQEIISRIEENCGTKISFDQYYSNDEFLRRWREQKDYYDIIIFSNTIYKGIKNEIPVIKNSNLWKQSKKYNPTIKKHFLINKYPSNIVYFVHSLTGFMYNSNVISLSASDSIFTIFKKSKNKIVIIVDDPVEAKKLLSLGFKHFHSGNILNSGNFKKLSQGAKIYIGNNFNKIFNLPNFAFAFAWSGAAILQMQRKDIQFKFLIHPDLSYISSDLLAQLNENKITECVASNLTNEKTLQQIENHSYYFSSYTNTDNIPNKDFRKIYMQFLNSLSDLQWIDSVDLDEFNSTNRSWDSIKLDLIKGNLHVESL